MKFSDMHVKLREKSFWWKLTFPFAHKNYTLLGETIYYPKGFPPSSLTVKHEEVHLAQKKRIGKFKFTLKYMLLFPIIYNPFRYEMEYEAYKKAQKYSDEHIHSILSSASYGWLVKPKGF